jgi:phage tail-like protein
MPLSYASLHLTWKNPPSADCTQLLLVRNSRNLPQDETDGAQVFSVVSNGAYNAINVGTMNALTDQRLAGGFIYYSMFGWSSSSQIWVRCTDLIALVPLPWGYGWRLYNLLPMAYRDADIVLVDPYNPWLETDPNPPLQRYMNLLGFQLDFIRTELESLMSVNDVNSMSGALLPLMAQQLGLPHEPEIGMQQERQLVANAVHLYKFKGSCRGITEMASILTSYPATTLVHHGYNCLNCWDDGAFPDGIGTWQIWTPLAGLALTQIPNLPAAGTTDPLTTYPGTFPTFQQPYTDTGMKVQATTAGTYDIFSGPIPITDFMSQTGGPADITWRIQIWSSVARTVELSVWGDPAGGVVGANNTKVPVIAAQNYTETAGAWTMMTLTGLCNPYPQTPIGATTPYGPASFYALYPRIRIIGAAANETHYITLCGLWPCTPAQIGVDTPVYDYPRDTKILVEPQASNLLSNTVTTFSRVNPNPPPNNLNIGFDGLANTVDPNNPSGLNLLTTNQSSFEDGSTGGWTTLLNCTEANSTNFAQAGTHSLAITSSVTGSSTNRVYVQTAFALPMVIPGQTFTVSGYFYAGIVARQVAIYPVFTAPDGRTYVGSTSPPSTVTEVTGQWVQYTTTTTVPQGANGMWIRAEVQNPAINEIHYLDNITVTHANVVQSCAMSIRYATVEDPPSLLPINGNAALQVTASAPGGTIWWGKVTIWSPAPPTPAGWFASSRPPPPSYTDGHTTDWYPGATQGSNARNWMDPTWGWFMMNQQYFGIGTTVVNGAWFSLPPQAQNYGNLLPFNVNAGQPFNFSVYAQYLLAVDPSNAQMLLGLRWYYPDGTYVETTYPVMLTTTYQRYSIPNPSDPTTAYLGEPPPQAITGIAPTLVYPFVRFPLAQNATFLLNSAMLSPTIALQVYMDATSFTSASGDFVQDAGGASYVYRRRTPRIARLTEQAYRWLPMGSTYTITYASGAVTPPLDPTLWP